MILSSLALAAVGLAAADALGAPTWLMSLLAGVSLLVAAIGMVSVRRTQARIIDLSGAIAAAPRLALPSQDAGDEIGILARAITTFVDAARRTDEEARAAAASMHTRRQDAMVAATANFGADIEK